MKRKLCIVSLATAALLGMSSAWADLTGDWTFNVQVAGAGSGSAAVTIVEADNGSLTGQYSGQLGDTDITGQREDDSFTFDVNTDMGTISYAGEVREDGTLAGTLDLGGMAEGRFEAERQQ